VITGVASAASAAAAGVEVPAAVVGVVAAVALEAEGLGEMGEPAAVGASEGEAALDNVLYSASPSTNLEADPAKSDASDVFLYALAGCFPFHTFVTISDMVSSLLTYL